MTFKSLIAAPLALSLLVTSREELVFAPAKNLLLVKAFEFSSENESKDALDPGSSASTFGTDLEIIIRDAVIDRNDERVTRLRRTLVEISGDYWTSSGDTQEREALISEIEDATVVFVWDEENEEYAASSEDIPDDMLEDLVYDFDFGSLLPETEVSAGDEWTIDAESFMNLMSPPGVLTLHPDIGDYVYVGMDEQDVEESHECEIRATFGGTRDEDGVRVGVVSLAGGIQSEEARDEEWDSLTFHTEMAGTVEIRGEALWNLEGHHLFSFVIEATSECITSTYSDDEASEEESKDTKSKSTYTVVFALEKK